jgi:hypothetical protein
MSITFKEANQVRFSLKMKYSNYHWYCGSGVFASPEEYYIVISVKKVTDKIRKMIPPLVHGVSVKVESEK